jgi:NADH-quinone oxidoreductase subunit L
MTSIPIALEILFASSIFWLILQTLNGYYKLHFSERLVRLGTLIFCIILISTNLWIYFQFKHTGSPITVQLPDWLNLKGYRFLSILFVDRYGVYFALFSSFIFLFIAKFSFSYLHKDEGYFRYFILITTLALGIQLVSYAGSLDILFLGWEIIGITSIHLISYFHNNIRSVQNSFRTLVFYRICDVAFLSACVLLHFYDHGTDFQTIRSHSSDQLSHWIGFFFILASLAKSAQFPFSGWFFRAMEGPTTSSAIYYGALSIHLGPFLLIRTMPLWANSLTSRTVIFIIGVLSALYASLVGKTRSDVKSTLAYSTITQVGLIYIELSLGLTNLAFFHLISHGFLRCWQFLRSASIIQDFLHAPIHAEQFLHDPKEPHFNSTLLQSIHRRLYIHALNGFYLDAIQEKYFVTPFLKLSDFLFKRRVWIYLIVPSTLILAFLPKYHEAEGAFIWICLFFSLFFSFMGFSSKLKETLLFVILSQAFMSLSALFLGKIAQQTALIQLLALVVIGPALFYLMRRLDGIRASHPHLRQGLSHFYPHLTLALLLLGWLAVGAPGSPICISEDIIFYELVEVSPWTTLLFSLCSFTNFVAFYYQFSKLFYGSWDPYRTSGHQEVALSPDLSKREHLSLGIIITLIMFFGLYPSLLLR